MNKPIHPAVAEHVMEENERLRSAIQRAVQEFDDCDAFNAEGRAVELMEDLRAALSQQAEPAPAQDERSDALEAIHQYAFEVGGMEDGGYMLEPEELNEVVRRANEPFEDVLRSLACSLGAGGYNAPTVDPAVFEQKIRWGIDQLARSAQTEQQPVMWMSLVLKGSLAGELVQVDHDSPPNPALYGKPFALYAAPIAQTAPQPEQSGWIIAAERVPSNEVGEVLVLMDDGSCEIAWASYWHGARTDFAGWTFRDPDEDRTPTHWMPLPARAALSTQDPKP